MTEIVTTGCQCNPENYPYPHWCERHSVSKHPHWVFLCQTNAAYFDAYEAGRGPGQPQPEMKRFTAVGVATCQHRSPSIGNTKRCCGSCLVYQCSKHSTYCTLTTPSQWNLPLIVDGKPTVTRITRENSRACSLCIMNEENL